MLMRSALFSSAAGKSPPLQFPLSEVCHFMLSADPPPASPLTLAYRLPRRLFPLPFKCAPSPTKSSTSTQLFGSTHVSLTAFATQAILSFRPPIRRHDTSLRLSTRLRTSLDFGNFFFAAATYAYTSPIIKSRFLVVPRSFYPRV